LANNLFAVGEYPLALEMYQETKGPELSTQQQFWVEYQTANCYRRLGNPAEASNRYRKLASQSEAGWLSRQAHWWVETLESIRIPRKSAEG
jgi:tetratricopeptide (TPR) repeat protein